MTEQDNIRAEIHNDGEMESWETNSQYSRHDAVHVVAGALLAGADKIEVSTETQVVQDAVNNDD